MTSDFDWRGNPAFDAWDSLPPETRDAALAAGEQGWREVFDGIATFNQTWRPVRPVLVEQARFDALNALTDRVLQLLLDACLRRARTAGELRKLLGVPDGLIEFLDDDEPIGEHLVQAGRPDVLISGGVPRFVEFNVGSDVGSAWDSDKVSARFLELFRRHGLTDRLSMTIPLPAVDGRFQAIKDWLGGAGRLTMVFRSDGEYPGMDDVPGLIRGLDPFVERGREFGFDMDALPLSWLELDERGRLHHDGRTVEAVLRLFVCSAVPPGRGLDALTAALRSGTASLFTSSTCWLLSNKLVFAWLWEDLDHLSAADRQVVSDHLPRTRVLTEALLPAAISERDRLVLKPTDDFGGAGVLVGWETEPAAWQQGLVEGARRGGFLLQDYVRPDRLTMDFVRLADGERRRSEVPFSVGAYTFGRRPAGCYLRIGNQEQGEVLNLKRGIHVTGPLIVKTEASPATTAGQGRG